MTLNQLIAILNEIPKETWGDVEVVCTEDEEPIELVKLDIAELIFKVPPPKEGQVIGDPKTKVIILL